MAKRWNEDDDDLDVDLEFDRVEYMKKEINKGKSTLIAVAIAPIFAVVTMFIFTLTMEPLISLATEMLGLIFLKPIYDLLNIDIDKIGKKGWVKNGGVYFLTLLAVWIILMNPPFGDFVEPEINEMEIEVYDEEHGWISLEEGNISEKDEWDVRVRLKITSNTKMEKVTIGPSRGFGTEVETKENIEPVEDHWYVIEYDDLERNKEYEMEIYMEDTNGNSKTEFRSFALEENE